MNRVTITVILTITLGGFVVLIGSRPASSYSTTPEQSIAPSSSETTLKTSTLPVSVEVLVDETIVRLKPTRKVRRRGVVKKGARLPVFDSARGFGCKGSWYKVHTEGWICADQAKISHLPPLAPHYPVVPKGELTPWPYGFVREPTLEYRVKYGELEEVREVLKGFGFGIHSIIRHLGEKYFRTPRGTLIHRNDAGMTDRISTYQGMHIIEKRPWPIGFVNSRRAFVYASPSKLRQNRVSKIERFTPFEVLEEVRIGKQKFYRFEEDAWLSHTHVRITRPTSLPKGVDENERWIDVDTKEQLITAYEGKKPVYVALMSSGRYGPSSTVKGEYRIWAKVSAIAMDNTDEELEEASEGTPEAVAAAEESTNEERRLYSLHDVPWTQFFFESYALHGVYWHNGFGNRRSHGCVNLSPTDARWFYNWTKPMVPKGWWAIHTTNDNPGTLVKVR